ncbi:MAG: DUF447 domain-containing protein [Candidatus Odinarchaeota archaeon]
MDLSFPDFLRIFGILPGTIYEILITTVTKAGTLSTAPFGAIFQQHRGAIELFAYDGSATLSNLRTTGACIINITQDPVLFYLALSKQKLDIELASDYPERSLTYQKIKTIDTLQPVDGVQGYIVARVISIVPQGIKYLITMEPVSCTQGEKNAVFSRGSAALIEMMVHLSRLGVYSDLKKNKELIHKVKELNLIVKKTGNKSWIELGDIIVRKADSLDRRI